MIIMEHLTCVFLSDKQIKLQTVLTAATTPPQYSRCNSNCSFRPVTITAGTCYRIYFIDKKTNFSSL